MGRNGEGNRKERGQVEGMGRDGGREGEEEGENDEGWEKNNRKQSCRKMTSHLPLQRFSETMKCKFGGTVSGPQWST